MKEELKRMKELAGLSNDDETIKTKKIFVLIGPPSVGKSTWINNFFSDVSPFIINRDDIAESVASQYG